jgi:hypothetical protein
MSIFHEFRRPGPDAMTSLPPVRHPSRFGGASQDSAFYTFLCLVVAYLLAAFFLSYTFVWQ